MSSARALLKAKRQEARVSHPLASYSASGQLKCIACGSIIKYASAWEGHVGSKAHRMNVVKMREAERLQEEHMLREEERTRGKRKAEDEEQETDIETKKRRVDGESDEDMHDSPSPPIAGNKPPNGFPTDFFSDPSRAPVLSGDDEDEDGDGRPAVPKDPVDLEWEQFQKTVLAAPMDPQADLRERFQNATIVAEPELALDVKNEGFPPLIGQEGAGVNGEEQPRDEDALRRKKEAEDRELIMDRLLDEERAQEEADEKVSVLKTKLEAIKRRREAAKAAKTASKGGK